MLGETFLTKGRGDIKSLFQVVRGFGYVILLQIFILDRGNVFSFIKVWVFAYITILVISFANILFGFYLPGSRFDPSVYSGEKVLPTGVFYNPNELAIFIIVSLPLVFSFFSHLRFFSKNGVLFSISIASFLILFLTGSRLGLISAGVVFISYFFLLWVRNSYYEYLAKVALMSFFLFLVFLFPFLLILLGSLGLEECAASLLGSRYNLIVAAFEVAKNSYFLGVGVGNAEHFVSNLPADIYDGPIINIHNMVMEVFVELGVLGLLIYFFVYLITLNRMIKPRRWSQGDKVFLDGAFLSLLGFLIMSPSGSSVVGMGITWLILAYGINLPGALRRS
nr:O-antigen ligase family protein [Chromohalobacter nigrandesensis]